MQGGFPTRRGVDRLTLAAMEGRPTELLTWAARNGRPLQLRMSALAFVEGIGRDVQVGMFCREDLRDELSCRGRHRQPKHSMAGGNNNIRQPRTSVNVRFAVVAQRPPAPQHPS
jgi:hypothetical protein